MRHICGMQPMPLFCGILMILKTLDGISKKEAWGGTIEIFLYFWPRLLLCSQERYLYVKYSSEVLKSYLTAKLPYEVSLTLLAQILMELILGQRSLTCFWWHTGTSSRKIHHNGMFRGFLASNFTGHEDRVRQQDESYSKLQTSTSINYSLNELGH